MYRHPRLDHRLGKIDLQWDVNMGITRCTLYEISCLTWTPRGGERWRYVSV